MVRRVLTSVALVLGMAMLVSTLVEMLHVAQKRELQGFLDSARFWRGAVIVERAVLAAVAIVVLLRQKAWSDRIAILTIPVWLVSVVDVVVVTQATVIP